MFQIEEVIQIPYEQTTCSKRAYDRGLGQKVIGFSYYGDSRSAHHQSKKYFQGIKNNLELLLKYYPDNWIIRQVFKGKIILIFRNWFPKLKHLDWVIANLGNQLWEISFYKINYIIDDSALIIYSYSTTSLSFETRNFLWIENIPDSNYFPSPNFFWGGVYYLTYYLIFAGSITI